MFLRPLGPADHNFHSMLSELVTLSDDPHLLARSRKESTVDKNGLNGLFATYST